MDDFDPTQDLFKAIGAVDGTFFVSAKDLSTGRTIEHNASALSATASCIKLFILIELARRIDEGRLHASHTVLVSDRHRVGGSGVLRFMQDDTPMSLQDIAMFMMSVSDNMATNILIDVLGTQAINDTARSIGCADTALLNPIDFERIGADIRNLATGTAADFAHALELVATDRLFGPEASRFVRRLLSSQQHLDLLPRYLDYNQYAKDLGQLPVLEIANKTGFFPGFRGDVAIIKRPSKTIVIAAFAEGLSDKTFAVEHPGAMAFGRLAQVVLASFDWDP